MSSANSGPNEKICIQFADQENIIIDSNIFLIKTSRVKLIQLPVFGRHLEFLGKGITVKVGVGAIEKLSFDNMGAAFGILSLGGTKPEIHLGGSLPP